MSSRIKGYSSQLLSLDYKGRTWYALVLLFFLTFFLPHAPVVNNIVTATILAFSFVKNSLKNKWEILKNRPALWFIFTFNFIELINAFFSHNHSEALRILGLRTPLLIFPIAIGTIEFSLMMRNMILRMYSWLIIGVAGICMSYAFWRYGHTGEVQYFYNDNLSEIIGRQSIYFAFMITLAMIFFVFELLKNRRSFSKRIAGLMAASFLFIIQFLLASRAALFTLVILSIPVLLYYVFRIPAHGSKKTFLVFILMAFCLTPFIFSRTIQRFKELQYTNFSYHNMARESHYNMPLTADQWNGANLRLAIWRCGLEVAQQHFWLGVPLGDKRQILYDKYREKGFFFGIQTKKNLHSNYLDVFSNLGIFGFLTFIIGFIISPLIVAATRKDAMGIAFIIALAIAFISETYFDRSVGCLLIGFFISFLLSGYQVKKEILLVIC